MYYVTSWCSTSGRSLATDDLAGVEALYPPSSSAEERGADGEPDHPADGASYTAPATVTVTATASDSDGSVARVDFLVNGAVAASRTVTRTQPR